MKKNQIKSWYGFLGVCGLAGFAGILNSSFYMFFVFFSFFSFFWEGKVNYKLEDERLQYNEMKAKSKLLDTSTILMLICILAFNNGITVEIFKIVLSLYFAFLVVGKSYLTYYYETKGI